MPRLTVALETSSRPSSIAVRSDDGAMASIVLDDSKSHASDLLPELAEMVAGMGATPKDIERIVVGVGPGSYTGLRVGCATALGLHRGTNAQIVGLSSFEAIAHAGLGVGERGVCLRNAFGGTIYAAAYGRSTEGLIQFQEPVCCKPADLKDVLTAEQIWLADAGAIKAVGDTVPAPAEVRSTAPSASALLDLSLEGRPTGPEAARPLYLRPFDVKVRSR